MSGFSNALKTSLETFNNIAKKVSCDFGPNDGGSYYYSDMTEGLATMMNVAGTTALLGTVVLFTMGAPISPLMAGAAGALLFANLVTQSDLGFYASQGAIWTTHAAMAGAVGVVAGAVAAPFSFGKTLLHENKMQNTTSRPQAKV